MNELILDIFLILVGVSCIVAPIWFGISLHKFRKTRKEGNLNEQSGHSRSLIASSIVVLPFALDPQTILIVELNLNTLSLYKRMFFN